MEPTNNNQPNTNIPIKKSHKGLGLGLAAVGLIAVTAVAVFAGKNTTDQTVTPDATTSTVATTPSTTSTVATTGSNTSPQANTYKDGTYTATGSYMSPGGLDQIAVTTTLKNDVITDISVNPEPGDNTSARYQNIFAASYKPLVIGKKISDVQLSKVSGSSLTSGGFNAALLKIEAQAQA
jgi:uncharacterized protein with FMN-binding domain